MWMEYELSSGEKITLNLSGVRKFIRCKSSPTEIYLLRLVYDKGDRETFTFKSEEERDDLYNKITKDFIRASMTIKKIIG